MEPFTGNPLFSCKICRNPLALRDQLLSKSFRARSGEAYLFRQAMNIVVGKKREQKLITGEFTIADIYCSNCGQVLGWKYLRAFKENQKWKEGKFILEKAKILKEY